MRTRTDLSPRSLQPAVDRLLQLAGRKARLIDQTWDPAKGTPVFTIDGRYTTRGWTEWTQGFQYGCAVLAFDGTDDRELLELGRGRTVELMAPHVTHTGVHDHGFNNLSTYGNLRRLLREGRVEHNAWELRFYEMALKASGAVQAARWSPTADGLGYVYSFNGPHSLFVDTMRTLRILGVAHTLGHALMGENDKRFNLLDRVVQHAQATSRYVLFHGNSGHTYDVAGRTAHEAVFNRNDGQFRCRSSQQGYSAFSTWTRGLAWAMLGFAEELEFFAALPEREFTAMGRPRGEVLDLLLDGARKTCDHYIDGCAALDGVVYWDDGAPGMSKLGDWRSRDADPFNEHEPVDASASAIAAQGLLRLGRHLGDGGERYTQAGLTVAARLMDEPYLATDENHQGLLLHSVYHRPNGWDHVPAGRKVPCGESSMWGDYHLLELAVYLQRAAGRGPYLTFFD